MAHDMAKDWGITCEAGGGESGGINWDFEVEEARREGGDIFSHFHPGSKSSISWIGFLAA